MSFLTKLLNKKRVTLAEYYANVPAAQLPEDTVSRAEHQRCIEQLNDEIATLNDELRAESNSIGNLVQRNRELQTQLLSARAEAEANKADAERYRARLKRDREYHAGRRVKAEVEANV